MKEKKKITKGTVIVLVAFFGIMAILNFTGVVSVGSLGFSLVGLKQKAAPSLWK